MGKYCLRKMISCQRSESDFVLYSVTSESRNGVELKKICISRLSIQIVTSRRIGVVGTMSEESARRRTSMTTSPKCSLCGDVIDTSAGISPPCINLVGAVLYNSVRR